MTGKKWKGYQGTYIKNPWAKPKRGRIKGGEAENGAKKMETTVLEQQFKKNKKLRKKQ